MTFSERLKLLREENFLTQDELAKKLNISRQSVSNYENGTRFPNDVQVLIKISQLFSVSIDYLIGISNSRIFFVNEHVKRSFNTTEEGINDFIKKRDAMENLFFELDSMSLENINKIIKCIKIFKEDN